MGSSHDERWRMAVALGVTLLVPGVAMAQSDQDPGQAIRQDAQDQADAIRREAQNQANSIRQEAGLPPQPAPSSSSDNDAAMDSRRRPESEDTNAGRASTTSATSGSSHSESKSTSNSLSIFFGGGGGHRHDGDDFRDSDELVGRWTLGQKGGGWACQMTLRPDEEFGLRKAEPLATCMSGFFQVSRWRANGRQLQLTDSNGNAIGTFRQVSPNRFEGYKESDHTGMYLGR